MSTSHPGSLVTCGGDAISRVLAANNAPKAHPGERQSRYPRTWNDSLREYLLISQHKPRLELFRRGDNDRLELHEAGPGESLELASVEAFLKTDDVYRDPLAPSNQ